jgi:hypothetical protein
MGEDFVGGWIWVTGPAVDVGGCTGGDCVAAELRDKRIPEGSRARERTPREAEHGEEGEMRNCSSA